MIQPAGLFIGEMRRETVEDKLVIGIEETDFFIIEKRLIDTVHINILRSLDTGTTRRIKNMTIGIRRSLSAVMT